MRNASFLALLGIVLTNCGGEPRLVPPAEPSPKLTVATTVATSELLLATPSESVAPTIGQIVWAAAIDETTNSPTSTVSTYPADAHRIIAAAPAQSIATGSNIEANWEYNNTSLDSLKSQLIPTEVIDQTWIAFHIDRDLDVPWPAGIYEITISVNGSSMQQASVEVTE